MTAISRTGLNRRTLLAGAAAGVLAAPHVSRGQGKEPIKIGMPTVLSGRFTVVGDSARGAAGLAIDAFNAAGGLDGRMIELVARGVDMFDCVLPTRVARNGTAYTRRGAIGIKGGQFKADFHPIEEGCSCFACKHFTRAYLRHLLNVNEILGLRMLSVHNTHMYLRTMADARAHLAAGTFGEFYREFIASFKPSEKILAQRKKHAPAI